MTLVGIPLIDRLGRRPLLVAPISIMIFDFIALTAFLKFQSMYNFFPLLSIACILLFIMCFALSLGPIPFLYAAEVFPQNARNSAISLCLLMNMLATLALTLGFPPLHQLLDQYVFLVFSGFMIVALFIIVVKVSLLWQLLFSFPIRMSFVYMF
jgi:hypothetical protein